MIHEEVPHRARSKAHESYKQFINTSHRSQLELRHCISRLTPLCFTGGPIRIIKGDTSLIFGISHFRWGNFSGSPMNTEDSQNYGATVDDNKNQYDKQFANHHTSIFRYQTVNGDNFGAGSKSIQYLKL